MTPFSHWVFLFGTMILYFVIGFIVFALYGPKRDNGGADR